MHWPYRTFWLCTLGAGVFLSACDPLSFLDEAGTDAAARRNAAGVRGWTCQRVLSPTLFVLEEKGRMVTTALEHVAVARPVARVGAPPALRQLPPPRADALRAAALLLATQMLTGTTVTLEPLPGYTDKRVIARVLVQNVVDLGEMLLDAGLAVLVTNTPRAVPPSYVIAQQRAMQRELGVWAATVPLLQRFRIEPRGRLVSPRDLAADADAPLPKFHARDLYAAPRDTISEDAEPTERSTLRAAIDCSIETFGAPKKYELDVAWRAVLLQNELSGPLDSFTVGEDAWDSLLVGVYGGTRTNLLVYTPTHELTRVTRATRHVYTGEIITGFDVRVLVDGQEIYSNRVTFSTGATLSALD
jgi:hypothetical protein